MKGPEAEHVKLIRRALEITEGPAVVLGFDPEAADALYFTCRRNKRTLFTFVTDTEQFNDLQNEGGRWHRVVLLAHWDAAHLDWNMTDPTTTAVPPQRSGVAVVNNGRAGDFERCKEYCDVVIMLGSREPLVWCEPKLYGRMYA